VKADLLQRCSLKDVVACVVASTLRHSELETQLELVNRIMKQKHAEMSLIQMSSLPLR